MINILAEYPLLLLFVVASLGTLIGSLKFRNKSLGVAAVLFTGLAFGALDPRLQIPKIILLLGLSIFVYSIGLTSGPAFFASYKKNGVRDFLFILAILIVTGAVSVGVYFAFGFTPSEIAGVYTGSSTNTAALAGVIDYITNTQPEGSSPAMIEEAVVGYSFSYVMGVMGGIIAIVVMARLLKIDFKAEEKSLRKIYPVGEKLTSSTIEITQEEACGHSLRDLFKKHNWNVVFGRVMLDGKVSLANWDTSLKMGDRVMVVGSKEDIKEVRNVLGKKAEASLSRDRTAFDVRRIFVSNAKLTGRTIASLEIDKKFNAIITRIRRGDADLLATGTTVLELGDRVRFIARREDLDELSKYFGDSYQESSKVNLFTFGLGIGMGLILGSIEISLGPAFTFKLGYAGGPLVVGLILGAVRRTGPVVWTLPYSANVTLSQIGLMLLLAAIGVGSGQAFVQSANIEGVWIFLASAIISLVTAFLILAVGYKWLKIPFSVLTGMVSNQPAILDFATTRTQNRIPMVGYAMMFPIALIGKIIISQLLFVILQ